MAFIISVMVLFGAAHTAILLKTLSYIERIEKAIKSDE